MLESDASCSAMWPVWEAKVDFDNDDTALLKTGGKVLQEKIFSKELQEKDPQNTDDLACMMAMEACPHVLMKAVYCFYKAIEARSSVQLIENEGLKWQGGYAVATEDGKRILGDIAVASDDWG